MPGGVPSDELIARVRAAAEHWINGHAPAVIPCGGQREDEPIPEAMWMAEQLAAFGLPAGAIHSETESLNTEQNLRNAQQMIYAWGGSTALIVTSDVHMKRAMAVCRDIGLKAKAAPVYIEGKRWKARFIEALGWAEYKLGMQRKGEAGLISRIVRKATRS